MASAQRSLPQSIGRYRLHAEIAAGGMGTVHLGRLVATGGFSRTVAIKRLHPHLASDPDFVKMFLDEARLAARVRHPNVVSSVDMLSTDGEFLVVMDYVHGLALSRLVGRARERGERIPIDVAIAIITGVLHGLHAAHEATDERGAPLAIVHRDVSPQNVMIGADGIARVLDFGIAKAAHRLHTTREGEVRGKLRYMAPEQFLGLEVDRRADIYAAGVVLWELLAGRKLFPDDAAAAGAHVRSNLPSPSSVAPDVDAALDAVTMRALAREPGDRYDTARDMALALEETTAVAGASRVGNWLASLAGDGLASLATRVAEVEASDDAVQTASLSGNESGPRVAVARASSADVDTSVVAEAAASPDVRRRRIAVGFGAISVLLGACALFFYARESTTAAAATPSTTNVPALAPSPPEPAPMSAPTPITTNSTAAIEAPTAEPPPSNAATKSSPRSRAPAKSPRTTTPANATKKPRDLYEKPW